LAIRCASGAESNGIPISCVRQEGRDEVADAVDDLLVNLDDLGASPARARGGHFGELK
jgi:hypothetical protein